MVSHNLRKRREENGETYCEEICTLSWTLFAAFRRVCRIRRAPCARIVTTSRMLDLDDLGTINLAVKIKFSVGIDLLLGSIYDLTYPKSPSICVQYGFMIVSPNLNPAITSGLHAYSCQYSRHVQYSDARQWQIRVARSIRNIGQTSSLSRDS
jgi:hypothetical protein